MIFSIAIYAAPSSQTAHSAYQFTLAALKQGHSIHRVFFYADGVYQGTDLACLPQDEWSIYDAWKVIKADYNLDLVLCIAASLKRGVLNAEEAQRYEKTKDNMATIFTLSGLGQFADAAILSDRLITFAD